ncbi:MAG: hypothetical protein ACK5MG_09730 [Bacteroidales bacterium]
MKTFKERKRMITALQDEIASTPQKDMFGNDKHKEPRIMISIISGEYDLSEIREEHGEDSDETSMAELAYEWLIGSLPDEELLD